jgi:hypothetical protein
MPNYTLIHITGTESTSGDNELVAAPGSGFRIVVTALTMQNESAVATTMKMKDGSTDKFRILGQNQGDGLGREFNLEQEWRLSENSALNFNLSGNNSCGYNVSYFLENV